MRFKWISYSLAFRLADSNGLFFALMLFLTLILSVTSLAALVSNLIMFTQADFFLRLALTTLGFFLPFIHSEDFGSFLIEAVFIGLFLLYLYKNNYRKQDTTEFENYKQM
ncbi:hypothetical protein [Ligilactobacillus salitolerans]|nr:hypothetical protein [Ligilactobacillus salitolerans]